MDLLHSYISNFKDRFSGAVISFGIIALILLSIELLIRSTSLSDHVPGPTVYYHPGVPKRLAALEEFLKQSPKTDMVFIGSSAVRSDISPLVFDTTIEDLCNRPHRSFNLGQSGLLPHEVLLFLENLWLERTSPRTIVQGLRLNELIWHEKNPEDSTLRSGTLEELWQGNLLRQLQADVVERTRLLQYPALLGKTLKQYTHGNFKFPEYFHGYTMDSRGFTPRHRKLSEVKHMKQFRFEEPYESLTRERFSKTLTYLSKTIDAAQQHGAQYVLIVMPEHAHKFSAAHSQQLYSLYIETLSKFAKNKGISFVDLSEGNATHYTSEEAFSDYNHLNETGAREFSTKLANSLANNNCS